jgi:MoxR-like ATPase
MKKEYIVIIPNNSTGTIVGLSPTGEDISHYTRPVMLKDALVNNQVILYNPTTNKCRRVLPSDATEWLESNQTINMGSTQSNEPMPEPTEIAQFINSSNQIKPNELHISDIKWKYLIRNVMRGKNIMMTGPAGSGKTMAANCVANALHREFFYFNLGATQDPRSTLIGNTHFNPTDGTVFAQSLFVKAIQTENAIILLDELSRAHPEAWNILMTVLDQGQRYLRLDEDKDTKTVAVAEGVSFIATANIGSEYTATRAMDRALLDRFIIVEMEALDESMEYALLKNLYGNVPDQLLRDISEIAHTTRREVRLENPKISSAISTRLTKEMASLIEDGFTLGEAAEVAIYPFYDTEGGVDSERTYIKQLVQKYIALPDNYSNDSNPF